MTNPLLTVEALSKSFKVGSRFLNRSDDFWAVRDVSFQIREGKTLGLVGESGSGKSTVALCVLQLLQPTSGSIRFGDLELSGLSRGELRPIRREMQVVFQDPYGSLDPRMNVRANVEEALIAHRWSDPRRRRERVAETLELVGLGADYMNRYPRQLSGGQRQRVCIARALALEPCLIVCDEPVSALDVSIQAQIMNLLKDLQSEKGLAYLFIGHDLAVVQAMSDDIAVMQNGTIVESGPAETLLSRPHHEYTQQLLAAVPSW